MSDPLSDLTAHFAQLEAAQEAPPPPCPIYVTSPVRFREWQRRMLAGDPHGAYMALAAGSDEARGAMGKEDGEG